MSQYFKTLSVSSFRKVKSYNEKGRSKNVQKRRKELEHKVKERMGKEKDDEKNKEEEGVVYKVNCKNCEMIYRYRRNKV